MKKLTKYEPTRRFTIKADGFHGSYYKPEQDHFPGKAMVIVGGSAGSFTLTEMTAEKFYEAGMNVLALAYRDVDGAPHSLLGIPLELAENGVKWCREHVAEKVGVWGISLGGELALLLGSLCSNLVSCVIAVNPMHFSQQGLQSFQSLEFEECSCFTFRGKDLPYYPIGMSGKEFRKRIRKDSRRHHEIQYIRGFYEEAVPKMPEDADYIINVEQTKGPILLLSAGQDSMLPSELICQTVCKRLAEHHFPYPLEHRNYEAASHYLLPVKPLSAKLFRVERKYPKDCDASRRAAWEDTLRFLQEKWQ